MLSINLTKLRMPVSGLLISCTTLADNFPKERSSCLRAACGCGLISWVISRDRSTTRLDPPFLIIQRVTDHVKIAFPAILIEVHVDGGGGLARSHGLFKGTGMIGDSAGLLQVV